MIKGWVQPEGIQSLRAKIDQVPKKALKELRPAVASLAKQLRSLARSLAPKDTGRLARSIKYKTKVYPDAVVGRVFATSRVAHLMEAGFQGEERVKPYFRAVAEVFGHQLKSVKITMVRAHTRQVNYPERSFMRWGLRGMSGQIKSELTQAVEKAAHDEP